MFILSHFWRSPSNFPGVYRIRNKVTGREYIGGTNRPIRVRWDQHIGNLNCQRHKNRLLQSDWIKYGADAFEFSVIETVRGDYDKVFERERYWQDLNYDRAQRYNPKNGDVQRTYFAQDQGVAQILLPPVFDSVSDLIDYLRDYPLSNEQATELLSWLYRDGKRMLSDDEIHDLVYSSRRMHSQMKRRTRA